MNTYTGGTPVQGCRQNHLYDSDKCLPRGFPLRQQKLTVVADKLVLLEEAVCEEGDVLGDVLRQELGEGARDAVRLDGEGNSVLGSLHEPRVVVDDGEGSLPEQKTWERNRGREVGG